MGQIKQYINLCNVAGVIDKDTNIYFVPHKSVLYGEYEEDVDTTVCACYKKVFVGVCPFSSKYLNKPITNWSPEDRSLVVEGDIKDFRFSRGNGLALNYLLLTREYYEEDSEGELVLDNTSYYGFFIDSIEEIGIKSIRLNLTVDHFTNFFYWNNEETLTVNYDPFNSIMKNAYVERQHYDRVVRDVLYGIIPTNNKLFFNQPTLEYKVMYKDKRYFLPFINENITMGEIEDIYENLNTPMSAFIFSTYLSSLTLKQKKILASILLKFVVIRYKENIIDYASVTKLRGEDPSQYGYTKVDTSFMDSGAQIQNPLPTVVSPIFDSSSNYPALRQVTSHATLYRGQFNYEGTLITSEGKRQSVDINSIRGGENGVEQYILAKDIIKYSKCIDMLTDIVIQGGTSLVFVFTGLLYNGNSEVSYRGTPYSYSAVSDSVKTPNQNCFVFLPTKDRLLSYGSEGSEILIEPEITISSTTVSAGAGTLAIMLRTPDNNKIDLSVYSDNISAVSVKSFYYEPVLEADPYKFYSLSLYESETILNKNKYANSFYHFNLGGYEVGGYKISLLLIQGFSEVYKVGVIPFYNVYDGDKIPYYSEGLVVTLTNQLPINIDSYFTYMLNNKAQMKNQYAVNDYQRATDMLSTIVSAPTEALGGFLTGGSAKAGATTVKSVGSLLSQGLEWSRSGAVIDMNQKAQLADMGARPNTIKQAGSDIYYELLTNDLGVHLNRYKIDDTSYNSNAKMFERVGYYVNRYEDSLHIFSRIGLNYIKLKSFDFIEDSAKLSVEEMNAVTDIFVGGVTLLHDKEYLHNLGEPNYHNYEYFLKD